MLTKTAPHPEASATDDTDFEVVVRRKQGTAPSAPIASDRLANGIGTVLVVSAMALSLGWVIGDRTGQSSAKAKIESSERSAQVARLQADKLTQEKSAFCQGAKP